jgi:biopolymer transport protein ExbD
MILYVQISPLTLTNMAEITTNNSGQGRGKKIRSKKVSLKIDMTPMVDLAFLLLTFFMLANTFLEPKAMEIVMPEKTRDSTTTPVNIRNVLTLALGENDRIYYSLGGAELKTTTYAPDGLRKLLTETLAANPKKLYVIIKPTSKSKYHNLVDVVDEMNITKMPRYALVDATDEDLKSIALLK